MCMFRIHSKTDGTISTKFGECNIRMVPFKKRRTTDISVGITRINGITADVFKFQPLREREERHPYRLEVERGDIKIMRNRLRLVSNP